MFKSILSTTPTFLEVILLLGVSIAMGVIFSILYVKIKQLFGFHKDMPITFILLPVVITGICIAVIAITNSISSTSSSLSYERITVAVVAALLLIRFRSELRNYEDLTYIFAFSGIGIILGFGYLYFALLCYGILLVLIALILDVIAITQITI